MPPLTKWTQRQYDRFGKSLQKAKWLEDHARERAETGTMSRLEAEVLRERIAECYEDPKK